MFTQFVWHSLVSTKYPSQHKKERVYVTLNGYRNDDFKTYIFQSDNYGETWTDISTNIPISPVNVIKEDPKKANNNNKSDSGDNAE